MGQQSEAVAHTGRAQRDELLESLGLDERATTGDVERVHADLTDFLSAAPRSLRAWAAAQASQADAALVALTDPSAADRPAALVGPAPRQKVRPGGTATPPARQAALRTGPAPRGAHAPAPNAVDRGIRMPRGLVRAGVAVALIALIGGGGYAVWRSGLPPTTGANPSQSPAASVSVIDEAAVAALMSRVQADPKDLEAMLDLGDIYFDAARYGVAADWLEKVIAIDPDDVRARLALGAARFNLGDSTAAETHWRKVVELDPKNVEAHYDLGFLYLNATPIDVEGVTREWNEVIRLAPGTDIAAVVKAHLEALPTPAPSAAGSADPSASPAPSPSAGPSASMPASPSPSGSVAP